MPVYNAERYLSETLQSVLKQTYKAFEVICINDASTDISLEILQQFQRLDNRIQIIENQERCGAAFSRNRGICEAKGDYITFLDADDIFEEEMLQSAYTAAEKDDVDIVIYEGMHVPSEQVYVKRSVRRNECFIGKYCMVPFSVRECEPIEFMNWADSPCNKLYKKSFIMSNKLEFQSLPNSNDVYFVEMALLLAEKIIALNDRRVMVYLRDHDGPSRISFDRNPMCTYQAMEKIGKELIKRKIFSDIFQYYYCRLFYELRTSLRSTKKSESARNFYDFLQKEGINNLASLSYDCYSEVDSYIHGLLENFKKLDFSIAWYNDETVFAFYLQKNAQKVISLFQSYEKNRVAAALWGIGVNGRTFLNFLNNNHLKVAEVIDKDENKCGRVINGYKVRKPNEVLEKIQVVIVCTFGIYKDIFDELQGTEIEVVDMESIVGKV